MIALNYTSTTVFLISVLWCIYACMSLAHGPRIVTVGLYGYACIELHWIAENCFPKWLQQFKPHQIFMRVIVKALAGFLMVAILLTAWCYFMTPSWLSLKVIGHLDSLFYDTHIENICHFSAELLIFFLPDL